MIENGSITYEGARDPIRTLEPGSQETLQILAAVLATVLAYQLAGIIFDLLVGCKRKGTTRASDISILLLAEDSSPYAVLANLGWSRRISRCKYHTSPDASCEKSLKFIRFSVLLKLGLFLAAAPVTNLLAIFLTSEVDQEFTFADVSFGGLAFGISQEPFVKSVLDGKICRRIRDDLRKTDSAVAEFYFCGDADVTLNPGGVDNGGPTNFTVSKDNSDVTAAKNSYILDIANENLRARGEVYGEVVTRDGEFLMENLITVEDGERLLRNGLEYLLEACRNDSDSAVEMELGERLTNSSDTDIWSVTGSLTCTFDDPKTAIQALEKGTENVTFVGTNEFRVVNASDGESVVRIEDHVFFRRRASLVSFLVLVIVTASSLVIRIIVRAFTNNDLHVGIELLLKDTLNIPPYDSMLSVEDVVDYEKPVYSGRKRCEEDSCECV
eukprot:GFKZ01005632.1.p1 GENE.GFKZ01005632.1~~GFKZ01005632.1.p1  ORF type:complete len:441 (+),score=64.00 GFKZ01005632.1:275-1597(+)